MRKLKAFFRSRSRVLFYVFAFFTAVNLALFLLGHYRWRLIQPFFGMLSVLCMTLSGTIWFLGKRLFQKKVIGALMRIAIGGLCGFALFGTLAVSLLWGDRERYTYCSPGGENQLIVVESGFIDAALTAYPRRGFFYREQDNGVLSYHDLWSISEKLIQVEWVSEAEAAVRIVGANCRPNPWSNESGEIRVAFE